MTSQTIRSYRLRLTTYRSLLERLEQRVHQIDDLAEREIEGDIEQLGDPRNEEERKEADEQTDDSVADGVYGSFNLLIITRREDEADAAPDDVEQAEDRRDYETESDQCSDDLEDGAGFDEVADHNRGGEEVKRGTLGSNLLGLKNF